MSFSITSTTPVKSADSREPLRTIDTNRPIVNPPWSLPMGFPTDKGLKYKEEAKSKVEQIVLNLPSSPLKKSSDELHYEGIKLSPIKPKREPAFPPIWEIEKEFIRRKLQKRLALQDSGDVNLKSADKENEPQTLIATPNL